MSSDMYLWQCTKLQFCDEVHDWDRKYEHARSFEQALKAFESGQVLRDRDGDVVLDFREDEEPDRYWFRYALKDDPANGGVITRFKSLIYCILVPAADPVTDEEMAEIARSIASVRSE